MKEFMMLIDIKKKWQFIVSFLLSPLVKYDIILIVLFCIIIQDFDDISSVICEHCLKNQPINNTAFLFYCRTGKNRTTLAMAIAGLIMCHIQVNHMGRNFFVCFLYFVVWDRCFKWKSEVFLIVLLQKINI